MLSLPYRRVHPDGECNPEMIAALNTISEEEFERIVAEADSEEEGDEVMLNEENRELLEKLKRQLEEGAE